MTDKHWIVGIGIIVYLCSYLLFGVNVFLWAVIAHTSLVLILNAATEINADKSMKDLTELIVNSIRNEENAVKNSENVVELRGPDET